MFDLSLLNQKIFLSKLSIHKINFRRRLYFVFIPSLTLKMFFYIEFAPYDASFIHSSEKYLL